jgi:hypothetical protein
MKQRPNPKDMGAREIGAFLTHLVVDQHVAAATRNWAFTVCCSISSPLRTMLLLLP